MKSGKRFFVCSMLLAVTLASLSVFSACTNQRGKDSGGTSDQETAFLIGTYYCDAPSGAEWDFEMKGDGKYTLVIDGNTYNGDYTYFVGGGLSIDKDEYTLTYDATADSVTIVFGGNTYKFLKKVEYTVTFVSNGGSAVEAVKVLNGRTLSKPADPFFDGHYFVGWYSDPALKNAFAFDAEAITSNRTLYARFADVPANIDEFTVSFDLNGKSGNAIGSVTTVGQKLYNLPEAVASDGSHFVGWWTSFYNDGSKLAYEYNEQAIAEDITLYAVWESSDIRVSAEDGRIAWSSAGTNASYRVVIKTVESGVESAPYITGNRSYEYNFSAPGDYEITVTSGNTSGKAYYRHKALAKVTNFSVDGFTLVYNSVANAEKYLISVECGTVGHSHVDYDNGDSLVYDFSACDMKADGIVFTVKAVADGYISSEASFTFVRALEAVTSLSMDGANVSWAAVENATGYVVYVSNGSDYSETHIVDANTLTFSLGDLEKDNYSVSVTATAKGYNPSAPAVLTYQKTSLAAPKDLALSGEVLNWTATKGAIGYIVRINDKEFETETNSFRLTADYIVAGVDTYTISVVAVDTDPANNSAASASISMSIAFDTVDYAAGALTWNLVMGVDKYNVYVDDVLYATVTDGKGSCAIQFAKDGEVTLSVAYVDSDGHESAKLEKTVTVYKIELDVDGALVEVDDQYKAKGDPITLPDDLTSMGHTFGGWYNVQGGAENNGVKYEDLVFNSENGIKLYAYWIPEEYTVTLIGASAEVIDQITVKYGKAYSLGTVASEDPLKAFAGWYTEQNRGGKRYTNENGESNANWDDLRDVTLYVGYADILSFALTADGKGYSVSQGVGIAFVNTITVPAEYDGKPVTTIDSNAFKSCLRLNVVNIPDTIAEIVTQTAFQSCTNLTDINVYAVETENAKEIFYASYNGVLYYRNPFSGVSLAYVPAGKTGTYAMPSYLDFGLVDDQGGSVLSPVRVIPMGAFGGADPNSSATSNISELIISHTVNVIETRAFVNVSFSSASNSKLRVIGFEPTPEGAAESELVFAERAFEGLTYLETVTIPSRLKVFEPDAFDGCSRLAEVIIEASEDGAYSSEGGIVYNKNKTKIVYVPYAFNTEDSKFTIPSGVTTIGSKSFATNRSLKEIVIPGWVTLVEDYAFCRTGTSTDGSTTRYSNSTITALTFLGQRSEENPDPYLQVGECAFYGLSGLTELTIPANLNRMGANAFGATSKLTVVHIDTVGQVDFADNAFGSIPTSSTSTPSFYVTDVYIGKDTGDFGITAVFGATKLQNVFVEEGNPNYVSVDGVLYNLEQTSIIFYPTAREGAYVIPDTVTSIAARTFYDRDGLTEITIGYKVASIGESAFYSCGNLTKVTFAATPEGETPVELTIGKEAFRLCNNEGFTSIALPERTVSIAEGAFMTDAYLKSMYIPSTVTELGFTNDSYGPRLGVIDYTLTRLETVEIAAGNKNYAAIDGVIYALNEEGDPVTLLFCPRLKGGEIDVPKTVTFIQNSAFFYNQNVTKVFFSEGVEGELEIGTYAFYDTVSLKEIDLPEGLKTIKSRAFYYAPIESVVIPSTVEEIQATAFYYNRQLTTVIFAPTPEGKEPVALRLYGTTDSSSGYGTSYYGAFYYCTNLKQLVLPERTVEIGDYALTAYYSYQSSTNYNNIEEITIPASVEKIGKYAFYGNDKLKTVTFAEGSSLSEVGTYAFAYTGVTSVALPSTLTEVSGQMFYNCKSLKRVYIPNTVKSIATWAFYGSTLEELEMEEGIALETIGSYAFYNSKIGSIVIPATVVTIDQYAFSGCNNLSSVEFELVKGENDREYSNLAAIGRNAFEKTALTSFVFPETVGILDIGTVSGSTVTKALFSGCTRLTTVHLSSTVSNVDGLFSGCKSIQEITLAENHPNFSFFGDDTSILFNNPAEGEGLAVRYVIRLSEGGALRLPVGLTDISERAFENKYDLVEVWIPNTVKTIGNYAFATCINLKKVEFEENSQLSAISERMFSQCSMLESIEIPANVTTIGQYAFYDNVSLRSVTFPRFLTTIGQSAFSGCANLLEVALPSTVNSIGNSAFAYCVSLKKANIPAGLAGVTVNSSNYGNNIFQYNIELSDLTIEEGVTALSNYMFRYCVSLTEVNIPDSVTNIAQGAFVNCSGITNITLPETLTTIGANAFEYTGLKSITIPANVTSIGSSAFRHNDELESVTFARGENDKEIKTTFGTYAFADDPKLAAFDIPTTVNWTTPSTAATSAAYLFQNSGLKRIVIPDVATLTTLSNYMFDGCADLEEVIFEGNNVTAFGTYLFRGTTSLKSITLPSALKMTTASTAGTSAAYAFQNSGLESIIIPASSSITYISNYMFDGCKNLASVVFAEGNSVTTIGNYAFSGTTSLKNITLPSKLKNTSATVGTYMFQNSGIESITIPSDMTVIPNYAFDGCANLASVTFEGDVTQFGTYVFRGTTSLKGITLPATLKLSTASTAATSAAYAFQNSGLESITIPDSATITYISNYMFDGCANLSEVIFEGTKVTAFGNYAFRGTKSLKSITLPSTFKHTSATVGTYMFQNSGLESITIPSETTIIPNYAFAGCTSLASVTFEGNVTSLGTQAFYGCTALTSIELPATVTSINQQALALTGITSFEVPAKVTTLGQGALAGMPVTEFTVAAGNTAFSAVDGVIFNKNGEVVAFPAGLTGEYTVPVGVTGVGRIFEGSKITKLIIEDGEGAITAIPGYMFYGMADVKEIVLPSTITSIGTYAFAGCTSLEKIVLPGSITSWNSYMFQNCSSLKEVVFMEGITATYAGAAATGMFVNSPLLETVTLPSTLTSIGAYTFYNTGIKSITLPEGLTTIANFAFSGSGLEEIVLPSTLTTIGNNAFEGTAIKSINIPSSVASIGSNAFMGCSELEELLFEDDDPDAEEHVELVITGSSTGGFSTTTQTATAGLLFGCNKLKSIVLPARNMKMSSSSYGFLYALEGLELIDMSKPTFTVTAGYIGALCPNLENVIVGPNVTLSSYAFAYSQTKNVTIMEGVTTFPVSCFAFCNTIKNLYVPSTVVNMGSSGFIFNNWQEDQTVYFTYDMAQEGFAYKWNGPSTSLSGSIMPSVKCNFVWGYDPENAGEGEGE